jgi:hypothetical protein
MSPEALEFVEMFLDFALSAPGSRIIDELKNELLHRDCRFSLIEGSPGFGPVCWQSSEAPDVTVPEGPGAAIRGIDVTDKPQKPHQCEEGIPGDPPGTKRPMKVEAGMLFENGFGSCCHTEFKVAVSGPDSNQRIEKRVGAHDVPAGPMFLNQRHLCATRVEIALRTSNLDAGGGLYNPTHAAMLFSSHGVAVLGKAAFQVFRFADVNQLIVLVVNEINAGRAGK